MQSPFNIRIPPTSPFVFFVNGAPISKLQEREKVLGGRIFKSQCGHLTICQTAHSEGKNLHSYLFTQLSVVARGAKILNKSQQSSQRTAC